MLNAGREIILYGSGRRCNRMLPLLVRANMPIKAIIDSAHVKWGTFIENIEIQSPSLLCESSQAALCITVASQEQQGQIRNELKHKYGYDLKQEIQYDVLMLEAVVKIQKMKIEHMDFSKRTKSNIVFDCISGLGLGGIEEWTKGLCIELIKKGFDNIHIFTDMGEYHVPCILEPVINRVLDKRAYYFHENVLNCIMDYLTDLLPVTVITGKPESFVEAASLLKQIAPDKVRIISVIHGGEEHLYKLYDKYVAYTDFYVAVSEDIKRDLLARGINREKIASITCPVACDEVLKRTYTVDACQPVRIGYAGRIVVTQKRMDLMLQVIRQLEENKVSYIFEIAGDGVYKTEMEESIIANKWNHHVCFAGVFDRVRISEFWRKQDICINMADAEGRSISQLEAMANGVVPVVTCTSGTREDICDGVNGYLVTIGDYKEAADRIGYLAEHRELLPKFGQKAHDTVYPKCQKEIHTAFWERLLRNGYGYH